MATTNCKSKRTVCWYADGSPFGGVRLIDQRKLPLELCYQVCYTVEEVSNAISEMVVRGAPAIGAAGAYGMAIAGFSYKGETKEELLMRLNDAKIVLDGSRPTAVNLSWATLRMMEFAKTLASKPFSISDIQAKLLEEAEDLADQDVEINERMARHGLTVVPDNAKILHHCNTGALATVDIGTAIGVIYECHKQGKNIHVWVDETRPRLQGARLSAWELMREGVPMSLIADNAAGLLMLRGQVDVVLYGADRVAGNGDTANKIGTYKLSVVAHENNIPVYPVVPTSTIDLNITQGSDIPIEERSDEEVTTIGGVRIAPHGCKVYNPAFDVTPHRYITGIITEEGICYPPFEESLRTAKQRAQERIAQHQKDRLEKALAS